VEHAAVAFLIMAANAVTQTINGLGRLKVRAGLHWVNDIVIEGLKVGGVLCQTQMSGEKTERVIVGIGLNVRKRPAIVNDACVRGATAINEHVIDRDVYSLEEVFWPLVTNLEKNYLTLLDQGYTQLLAYYIENSALIGKTIEIFSDPQQGPTKKLGEGKALEINEDLELIIEGVAAPLRKGRVRLIQRD
jgi:BirA family biotin operon repressor/biotin-[acetyl-CoA-carboxylase] ligase